MARSVADVDGFITMLRVACEDATVNARLEKILALPDDARRTLLHTLISDMLIARAPQHFVEAIACLTDDEVAEKAYEAIFRCRRRT